MSVNTVIAGSYIRDHGLRQVFQFYNSTYLYLCSEAYSRQVIVSTGQLFISGVLLLYTAIVAPAQVFLWEFKEEECNAFPTLYFDIFVDIFFMV
jgi:hypothetical protein